MKRDTQRTKILAAEDQLIMSGFTPKGQSERELQRFINNITGRSYWKKHYQGSEDVFVVWGSRSMSRTACIPDLGYSRHVGSTQSTRSHYGHIIIVDSACETKLHVLHSLAHLLESGDDGNHDAAFVARYIELVRRFLHGQIDETAKRTFKKALLAQKVKTKVVSEETRNKQRAAYIKRMTPSEEKLLETLSSLEEL